MFVEVYQEHAENNYCKPVPLFYTQSAHLYSYKNAPSQCISLRVEDGKNALPNSMNMVIPGAFSPKNKYRKLRF